MNRDDFLFSYFESIKKRPLSWLDVGAGDRRVSDELERRQLGKGVCIDVSTRNDRVFLFDGKKLSFEDETFDVVLFNFVLHHAGINAVPLLRDALRIARLAVVLQEDLDDGTEETKEALRRHDPNGVFYSEQGWRQVFEMLGADVLKIQHFPASLVDDHPEYVVPRALCAVRKHVK